MIIHLKVTNWTLNTTHTDVEIALDAQFTDILKNQAPIPQRIDLENTPK